MGVEIVVRLPRERQAGGGGLPFERRVVRQHRGDVAGNQPRFVIRDQPRQAMVFAAAQQRHALGPPLAVQVDADLHVDATADVDQAGHQGRQVGREVGEVDEHVHDEQAADDALLDVLDVHAALGQVGGELRDGTFLVATEHGNDCEELAHGERV